MSAAYTYGIDGLRTEKVVTQNGTATTHKYYLQGGKIVAEKRGSNKLEYIYDGSGAPINFIYNGTKYYYITSHLGDVSQIRNSAGTVVAQYTYDPYGKLLTSSGSMASINPIRYRGYYFDAETSLYYLNSRYYDPNTARFINADSYISTGGSILSYNMFAYCQNNPVSMSDSDGDRPVYSAKADEATETKLQQEAREYYLTYANNNHDLNRRPNTGTPGSTYEAPNGDTRTFGPGRLPIHDYDHDDHGQPDRHPHDENGGHHHDWDWTKNPPRGKPYVFDWIPVIGVTIVVGSVIGIIIVAADNITGIGIADDFLFGPLGAAFTEGVKMVFS